MSVGTVTSAWPVGGEFLPDSSDEDWQWSGSAVLLEGGRHVVAWVSGDKLRAQIFTSAGVEVGNQISVADLYEFRGYLEPSPTVVALQAGRFAVLWASRSPGGYVEEIRLQIFDADGSKSGSELDVGTSSTWAEGLSAAASSHGRLFVTWTTASTTGEDASGSSIRARILNSDGSFFGDEFLVNTTVEDTQTYPSVTSLNDGRFVVSWTDWSSTGGDTSISAIRAQIFSPDGSRNGAEFLVNTTTIGFQQESSISALSDGRFIVSWTDLSFTGGDTSGSAIRAQIFNSDGSRDGDEFLVNTTTLNHQMESSIAPLADGRFVISWTDQSLGGDDIRAQIFLPDGNKFGHEFLVNSTQPYSQKSSDVAPLDEGRFIVLWASQGNFDYGRTAVVGQVFYAREPGGVDWTGTPFDDIYDGTQFDDWISGEAGDDTLSGLDGNDWIIGGDGNDFLYGDAGDDILEGELGYDHLFGGKGNDFLSGGDDFDFARYDQEHFDGGFAGISVNLADGLGTDTFKNTDTFSSVEGVVGSAFGDKIVGDSSGNGLYGLGGKDNIDGAGGNDWLVGGAGNDKLDGGSGFDFAEYDIDHESGGSKGISADLATGTVVDTFGKTDTLTSIEGIYGSIFKDNIEGNNKDNSLYGYVGNDNISGGAGNDWIFGGAGKDKLNGDDGWDYARYDADHFDGGYQGISANLKTGEVTDTFGKRDILKNFEGIVGSYYDDKIIGDNNSNGLYGYAGDDKLKGNGGDDGLIGDDGDDVANAGDGNDYLWGDAGNDRLLGKDGKDKLYGGDDDDTLIGGDGKDKLWGEAGSDVFVFDDSSGNDKIFDFDAFDALEMIDLSAVSRIKDYSDLISNHLKQDGTDCVIDDGKGNVITLVNVMISDLDASDFVF